MLGCLAYTPFFIAGYPLKEMNMGGWEQVFFFAVFIPNSILYMWIYYHTGRNTFSAIMFHFAGNFSGMVIVETSTASIIKGVFVFISAVAVIIFNPDLFFKKGEISEK